MKDSITTNGRRKPWRQKQENIVQWKQKNIKDGFVVVDEAQLSKLIKREPIERFYKLEDKPFATGLFASVRRCQSLETGEQFAAKFSCRKRYGEDCSAEIYHEIALLSLCGSGPRIIQIHDVFESSQEIVLVMEYAPGGDLQTIIDDNLVPYESDVVLYIRQCVEGLEYLHQRRIAHLDIKPQNIVMMGQFPTCDIKICDLEISRVILEGDNIREILGTPDYVAPEILHYDPITLAADMWSLGVTTYVLLTGFSPFGGETDQETFCNISRGEVDLPEELFGDVSETALDFIRTLLVKDPKCRPTASQCLRHPWLAQTPPPSKPITTPVPSSPSSLRKYLSKSREALFDRVVQQHKGSLRKHTLQSQLYNRTRMCESQLSLISKSREKLLSHDRVSPSFSRSIEKIYGLRSLSKSQEVLNLYKNGSLLTSQENINSVVSEILKSRENLLDKSPELDVKEKDRKLTRATTADLGILRHRNRKMRIYSGSSTTSIASDMPEEEEGREADAGADGDETKDTFLTATEIKNGISEDKHYPNEQSSSRETEETKKLHEQHSFSKEQHNKGNTETPLLGYTALTNKDLDGAQDSLSTKATVSTDKVETEDRDSDESGIEEPRFTVAQLVTAFNKHQDIVTKTSLEVTMTASQKQVKIPTIMPYSVQVPFPTGPTALRLFIPDIDLVEIPIKTKLKKNTDGQNKIDAPDENFKSLDVSDSLMAPFRRSTSHSSEASTAVSTEDTTPDSSLEPTDTVELKPPLKPSTLRVNNAKRSKSQSPSPVCEIEKNQIRKLSAGSYSGQNEGKKSGEAQRKPSTSTAAATIRKSSSVEKSPLPQRRNKAEMSPTPVRKTSTSGTSEFKIIGLGERNRKSHGISYKIEFSSPVVTRRFPVRTPGVCSKTTISSELKKQDSLKPRKK